jgi:hypothetical protein
MDELRQTNFTFASKTEEQGPVGSFVFVLLLLLF